MSQFLKNLPVSFFRTVVSSRPIFNRSNSFFSSISQCGGKFLIPAPRLAISSVGPNEKRSLSSILIKPKIVTQPLTDWNPCPNRRLSNRYKPRRSKTKLATGALRTFKSYSVQRQNKGPIEKKKPDIKDIEGSWKASKCKKFPFKVRFFAVEPPEKKPAPVKCKEEPPVKKIKGKAELEVKAFVPCQHEDIKSAIRGPEPKMQVCEDKIKHITPSINDNLRPMVKKNKSSLCNILKKKVVEKRALEDQKSCEPTCEEKKAEICPKKLPDIMTESAKICEEKKKFEDLCEKKEDPCKKPVTTLCKADPEEVCKPKEEKKCSDDKTVKPDAEKCPKVPPEPCPGDCPKPAETKECQKEEEPKCLENMKDECDNSADQNPLKQCIEMCKKLMKEPKTDEKVTECSAETEAAISTAPPIKSKKVHYKSSAGKKTKIKKCSNKDMIKQDKCKKQTPLTSTPSQKKPCTKKGKSCERDAPEDGGRLTPCGKKPCINATIPECEGKPKLKRKTSSGASKCNNQQILQSKKEKDSCAKSDKPKETTTKAASCTKACASSKKKSDPKVKPSVTKKRGPPVAKPSASKDKTPCKPCSKKKAERRVGKSTALMLTPYVRERGAGEKLSPQHKKKLAAKTKPVTSTPKLSAKLPERSEQPKDFVGGSKALLKSVCDALKKSPKPRKAKSDSVLSDKKSKKSLKSEYGAGVSKEVKREMSKASMRSEVKASRSKELVTKKTVSKGKQIEDTNQKKASKDTQKKNATEEKPCQKKEAAKKPSTVCQKKPSVTCQKKPSEVCQKKEAEKKPSEVCQKKKVETKPSEICQKKEAEKKPSQVCQKKDVEKKVCPKPSDVCQKKEVQEKPSDICQKKKVEKKPSEVCQKKPSKICQKKEPEKKPSEVCQKKKTEKKPSEVCQKKVEKKPSEVCQKKEVEEKPSDICQKKAEKPADVCKKKEPLDPCQKKEAEKKPVCQKKEADKKPSEICKKKEVEEDVCQKKEPEKKPSEVCQKKKPEKKPSEICKKKEVDEDVCQKKKAEKKPSEICKKKEVDEDVCQKKKAEKKPSEVCQKKPSTTCQKKAAEKKPSEVCQQKKPEKKPSVVCPKKEPEKKPSKVCQKKEVEQKPSKTKECQKKPSKDTQPRGICNKPSSSSLKPPQKKQSKTKKECVEMKPREAEVEPSECETEPKDPCSKDTGRLKPPRKINLEKKLEDAKKPECEDVCKKKSKLKDVCKSKSEKQIKPAPSKPVCSTASERKVLKEKPSKTKEVCQKLLGKDVKKTCAAGAKRECLEHWKGEEDVCPKPKSKLPVRKEPCKSAAPKEKIKEFVPCKYEKIKSAIRTIEPEEEKKEKIKEFVPCKYEKIKSSVRRPDCEETDITDKSPLMACIRECRKLKEKALKAKSDQEVDKLKAPKRKESTKSLKENVKKKDDKKASECQKKKKKEAEKKEFIPCKHEDIKSSVRGRCEKIDEEEEDVIKIFVPCQKERIKPPIVQKDCKEKRRPQSAKTKDCPKPSKPKRSKSKSDVCKPTPKKEDSCQKPKKSKSEKGCVPPEEEEEQCPKPKPTLESECQNALKAKAEERKIREIKTFVPCKYEDIKPGIRKPEQSACKNEDDQELPPLMQCIKECKMKKEQKLKKASEQDVCKKSEQDVCKESEQDVCKTKSQVCEEPKKDKPRFRSECDNMKPQKKRKPCATPKFKHSCQDIQCKSKAELKAAKKKKKAVKSKSDCNKKTKKKNGGSCKQKIGSDGSIVKPKAGKSKNSECFKAGEEESRKPTSRRKECEKTFDPCQHEDAGLLQQEPKDTEGVMQDRNPMALTIQECRSIGGDKAKDEAMSSQACPQTPRGDSCKTHTKDFSTWSALLNRAGIDLGHDDNPMMRTIRETRLKMIKTKRNASEDRGEQLAAKELGRRH